MREAAIAARGVSQRDDRRRMQVAVRCEELGANVELSVDLRFGQGGKPHADQPRQET